MLASIGHYILFQFQQRSLCHLYKPFLHPYQLLCRLLCDQEQCPKLVDCIQECLAKMITKIPGQKPRSAWRYQTVRISCLRNVFCREEYQWPSHLHLRKCPFSWLLQLQWWTFVICYPTRQSPWTFAACTVKLTTRETHLLAQVEFQTSQFSYCIST